MRNVFIGLPDYLTREANIHILGLLFRTSLEDFAKGLGKNREAVVCQDLTMPSEKCRRDTLGGLVEHYTASPFKGEFVIVVEGAGKRH